MVHALVHSPFANLTPVSITVCSHSVKSSLTCSFAGRSSASKTPNLDSMGSFKVIFIVHPQFIMTYQKGIHEQKVSCVS